MDCGIPSTTTIDSSVIRDAVERLERVEFVCKARPWEKLDPPNDCDWPACGCDPAANKVFDAIEESGNILIPRDTLKSVIKELAHKRAVLNQPELDGLLSECRKALCEESGV